jgi:hypothetical protein
MRYKLKENELKLSYSEIIMYIFVFITQISW